jgi:HK97 family phage prohead protease
MGNLERRYVNLEDLQLRVEKREDGQRVLTGYPIVFNRKSVNLGGFQEVVAPGAADETIRDDDIRALFNHDSNLILGRNRANTLKLTSDQRGVHMEVPLPDTTAARDLAVSIERGDVSGGSFSFNIKPGGAAWSDGEEENELPLRTVLKIRLYDVGPVTFPAYPDTEMGVRADTGDVARELEEWHSQRAAKLAELANQARRRELRMRGA